jgi:hypothetical protein
MISTASLLETLAELEHRQWQHWSQATAPQVPEILRARWQESWRPYAELPEEAKGTVRGRTKSWNCSVNAK